MVGRNCLEVCVVVNSGGGKEKGEDIILVCSLKEISPEVVPNSYPERESNLSGCSSEQHLKTEM